MEIDIKTHIIHTNCTKNPYEYLFFRPPRLIRYGVKRKISNGSTANQRNYTRFYIHFDIIRVLHSIYVEGNVLLTRKALFE